MILHTQDFVYGDIKYQSSNNDHIISDDEHSVSLHIGDEIVWVNKSHNQSWIETGIITSFDTIGGERIQGRIILDDIVSINPEGECYIGIINFAE